MSHFSRIRTSIRNLTVLQKTLEDLGLECSTEQYSIKNSYGDSQDVDLIVKSNNKNVLGFAWDGNQYNLVVDLQFWDQDMSVERFIDKIMQNYALNSVLNESIHQGFSTVKQEIMQDGAIKLVIQRWH